MSTQLLLIAPIVAPLAGAALALVARRWRTVQRIITAAALIVLTFAGFMLTVEAVDAKVVHTVVGAEEALYGIALTADPFGAALVAAAGLVAAVVVATMAMTGDDEHPFVHPLVLVLAAGASGSFITGDLFNLFVFFEVVLIASYVLVTLLAGRQQMRAAAVYIPVNLIGTLILLTGIAGVFAESGTVDLAHLAEQSLTENGAMPGALLVVVAFTLKAGLLPFSGWLVVGYPAAQRTMMALFAGTLTTVGIAALYRVVLLAFGGSSALRTGVLVAAVATLVIASLAAVAAKPHARVLALLIVTQVGFMAIGVGLGTTAGVTAGVFFVLQDVLVKTAIILAYWPLSERSASAAGARIPALWIFGLLGLSLVGIPPLTGFVGKVLLVEAAFAADAIVVAIAALAASAGTLAALLLLWRQAIETDPEPATDRRTPHAAARLTPAALVAVGALAVGVFPGWLLNVAEASADLLLDPSAYAEEVLGS